MRYRSALLLVLCIGCQNNSEPATTRSQREVNQTAQGPICSNGTFQPLVGQDRTPLGRPAANPESPDWRRAEERPIDWIPTAPAANVPPRPARYSAVQERYLQAWRDVAPTWAGLSEDEREARRIELKERILGGGQ
jgi:hypothetical protein